MKALLNSYISSVVIGDESTVVNQCRCGLRVLLFVAIGLPALAQPTDFFRGQEFQRQMKLPASIFWSQVPLSDAAANLSATRRLAIWVDRRLDPAHSMSFGANSPSLEACLFRLSKERREIDAAWIEGVIYLGPPKSANRFATVHAIHLQSLQKLPSAERGRWLKTRAMDWPRLTSPKTLVAELENQVGRRVVRAEIVPHDLWAAKRLPPLPAFARLELVLAGFDLTFVLQQDGTAKIIPMPKSPRWQKSVYLPQKRRAAVEAVLAEAPQVSWEDRDGETFLNASWKVHQQVRRAIYPRRPARRSPQIRYTLQADNQPLGQFVTTLCKQLSLQPEFSAAAQAKLKQRVSFSVKEADVKTLFTAILNPVELEFELSNKAIEIYAPGESDPPPSE